MKSYEKTIVIRINVEDDEILTNNELNNAFTRIESAVSAFVEKSRSVHFNAQEALGKTELDSVVVVRLR